jgi:hypothetical protein
MCRVNSVRSSSLIVCVTLEDDPINDSVPDTIDERVLNKAGKKIKQLNAFHMTENNNLLPGLIQNTLINGVWYAVVDQLCQDQAILALIKPAKGIGCSVVNIGSGDIIEVREHLILGLIWQIIRLPKQTTADDLPDEAQDEMLAHLDDIPASNVNN